MRTILRIAAVLCLIGAATPASAQFIGGLDGVSNSSIFETGAINNLPAQGWTNVSGTARIFDGPGLNGAIIGTAGFANYQVQYLTGVPIQANTLYTLHFDMGFDAGIAGGSATYSFELGTINGAVFTPLGAPATGIITRTGNMSAGVYSGSANIVFPTGPNVSGDNLAVRWAQLANPGPSDFFGFDNVTLSAAVIPPPAAIPTLGVTGGAILMLVLLLSGMYLRRR